MRPLAIDLFCGLGGWTDGLLAEGWNVVGFDNERHAYGEERYPSQLVIQDVLTLHGSQFKGASLIVASPPCQEYSWMAMPWSKAKERARQYESGERDRADLTRLFDACFRIQREACEAAGRHIPMVVENVRGAQRWVGRARWNYGSFYLWGDVPALMPVTARAAKRPGHDWNRYKETGEVSPHWRMDGQDSRKNPGFRFDGSGRSFQTESVARTDGRKQPGIGGPRDNGKGDGWFQNGAARHGSKSTARKAASARIAKIPLPLSRHIAQAWWPR